MTSISPQIDPLESCRESLKGLTGFPEITATPLVDENNLYLSIYAPAEFKSRPLKPVMVWIHGGGFANGGAHLYNGAALAGFGKVLGKLPYKEVVTTRWSSLNEVKEKNLQFYFNALKIL